MVVGKESSLSQGLKASIEEGKIIKK